MNTHIPLSEPGIRFALSMLTLMPVIAFAAESADYSITPLTIDAGGVRSTSTNYTIDSSITPGGAASSTDFTARNGYAGSLYDVIGLDLTGSPLTVNEGGTRQLGASLLLDDSTMLALAPSSVTWSVQSGPLASVSAGGHATAGVVYQDTNAVAQGGYQSFNLKRAMVLQEGTEETEKQ